MEQPKIRSSKGVTLAQMVCCLVLILVVCVSSFGTIFTVGFELDEDMTNSIESAINTIGGEAEDIEIQTEIDVDFFFLVRSAVASGDVIGEIIDTAKDAKEDMEHFDGEEALDNIKEKLMNQDFVNFIVLIVLIAGSFASNIFVGIGNLFLLGLTISLPITAVIATIRALIGVISNRSDVGKALHKISRAFYSVIAVFPMVLLVLVMVPDVRMGGAVYTIMGCCIACLVINFVGSRIKHYEGQDLRYINILQILCVVGLVGYVIFFFNFMQSGIINAAYSTFAKSVGTEIGEAIGGDKSVDYVPIVLTILLLIAVLSALDNLTRIVTRFACMNKGKSAVSIGTAVISLLVIALPIVMKSMDIDFEIAEESMSAFTVTSVGVGIMAAAEILLAVLINKLCPAVSKERRQEIVTGAYYYVAGENEAPAAPVYVAPQPSVTLPIMPAEKAPVTEEPVVEEVPVAEEEPETEAEPVAEDVSAEETL